MRAEPVRDAWKESPFVDGDGEEVIGMCAVTMLPLFAAMIRKGWTKLTSSCLEACCSKDLRSVF